MTTPSSSAPPNAFSAIHAPRSPIHDSLGNPYEVLTALPQPPSTSRYQSSTSPTSLSNSTTNSTASLPTILCLHGAGTSARIFRFQLRNLTSTLRSHFNFLFLDGPIPSPPGPGVLPYFEGVSPYYRWVSYVGRDGPKSKDAVARDWEEVSGEGGVVERLRGIATAMGKTERVGQAGGEIVGVMGFSQGCRVAAGLLLRQVRREVEKRRGEENDDGLNLELNLRFGVFIGGGWPYVRFAPPPSIPPPPPSPEDPSLSPAPDLALPLSLEEEARQPSFSRIAVPTVHAWGKDDPQKGPARLLVERCTNGVGVEGEVDEKGIALATEYEFNGGHHMPMVMGESRELAALVLRAWEEGKRLRRRQSKGEDEEVQEQKGGHENGAVG